MNDPLDLRDIASGAAEDKKVRSSNDNSDLMDLVLSTRQPMVADWTRRGAIIASVFFGALVLWSFLAPLSTGSTVSGSIIVSGNREVVEHLEGGIVREIKSSISGKPVKAGDFIMALDAGPADARLRELRTRIFALNSRLMRLRAEWNGEATLTLRPPESRDISVEAHQEIVSLEYSQFSLRKDLAKAQQKSLSDTINDNIAIAASLRDQKINVAAQLKLLDEEIADLDGLLEKGYASKSRVLALRRQREALLSEDLATDNRIVEQNNRVQAARLELDNFISGNKGQIAEQIQETQVELEALRGNLELAEDQKNRTIITAARDGIVMDVRAKSPGEVIEPGGPLFDLVPADAKLIVDGRLAAGDGANIKKDLPARITVTAFKGRNSPTLDGKVIGVSPDILTDERTGEAYYSVQIEFDETSIGSLTSSNQLQAGYPVQALIETDRQPIIYYLLSPLTASIRNALSEG